MAAVCVYSVMCSSCVHLVLVRMLCTAYWQMLNPECLSLTLSGSFSIYAYLKKNNQASMHIIKNMVLYNIKNAEPSLHTQTHPW